MLLAADEDPPLALEDAAAAAVVAMVDVIRIVAVVDTSTRPPLEATIVTPVDKEVMTVTCAEGEPALVEDAGRFVL